MIKGKMGGTGNYSFREVHNSRLSVQVTHMPEDGHKIRICIRHNGEAISPITVIGINEAEMLWAALDAMAGDLKWDKELSE